MTKRLILAPGERPVHFEHLDSEVLYTMQYQRRIGAAFALREAAEEMHRYATSFDSHVVRSWADYLEAMACDWEAK